MSVPFVVGPSLLKKIEQIEGNENVRYRNTRVVGPTPYLGDQVSLFTGLFRMKSKDWALQAIGLLETVAKTFDSTKLSSYMNIARPLTEGIESFLGMGDNMQLRIGHRTEFSDPTGGSVDAFVPGYWLMLRQKESEINKSDFWVKEGELFHGSNKNNMVPYTGSDYILYKIQKLQHRNDYSTFDFHKEWKNVQQGIWADNKQSATTAYHVLISNLRQSSDLIDTQKNQLQAYYLAQLKKEVQAFEAAKDPFEATAKSFDFGEEISKGLDLKGNEAKVLDITDQLTKITESTASKSFGQEEQDIQKALESDLLKQSEILELNVDEFSKFAARVADKDLNKT